jgi:hypothetical protein
MSSYVVGKSSLLLHLGWKTLLCCMDISACSEAMTVKRFIATIFTLRQMLHRGYFKKKNLR